MSCRSLSSISAQSLRIVRVSTMFVLRTCAPFCEIENQSSCSLGLSHQLLRGAGNGFEEGLVELGDHLHIAFAGELLFVRQQVFHLGRQQWRKTLSHALVLEIPVVALVQHVAVAIDLQPPKVPARRATLDGRGDRCLDVASVCTSGYKFAWTRCSVGHELERLSSGGNQSHIRWSMRTFGRPVFRCHTGEIRKTVGHTFVRATCASKRTTCLHEAPPTLLVGGADEPRRKTGLQPRYGCAKVRHTDITILTVNTEHGAGKHLAGSHTLTNPQH